jgi:hypothetical protein
MISAIAVSGRPAAVIAADSLAPEALPALAARISAALCASSG